MSKYMLIMRGDERALAAYESIDFAEVIAAMGDYNRAMMEAGVLLAGEGLTDAAQGVVVDFESTPPVVTDGPYGEIKELFNGFWMIEAATIEEAAEWAKRAPLGIGNKIEVRRVTDESDFPQTDEVKAQLEEEAEWRTQLEAKAAGN